jgi:cytochrome c553
VSSSSPNRDIRTLLTRFGLAWVCTVSLAAGSDPASDPGSAAESSPADLMSRQPWESCLYCHGEDGAVSSAQVPAIAGQPREYLERQLRAFRAGRRVDPERLMWSAVALLDDQDVPRVATYFASLSRSVAVEPGRTNGCADQSDVRRLFRQGRPGLPACVSCHPAQTDVSPEAGRPYLHGLRASYLQRRLRDYSAARQDGGDDTVMHAIASRLSPGEVRALGLYVAECVGRTDAQDR